MHNVPPALSIMSLFMFCDNNVLSRKIHLAAIHSGFYTLGFYNVGLHKTIGGAGIKIESYRL